MRRLLIVLAAAFATAALVVPAAFGVNAHLKGKNPISFTDNGLTLSTTVSYTGLGNFDTLQSVSATADPTADCVNPSGQHRPPGHQPAPVTVTGSTPIPKGDIKNGNVIISTDTNPPVTPIPGAPGCPNTGWTENITDMAFTSATIQLFQDSNGNGTFESSELVLTVNCTFSPSTSDGPVPASGFSCS
jgi:hypothetical protein